MAMLALLLLSVVSDICLPSHNLRPVTTATGKVYCNILLGGLFSTVKKRAFKWKSLFNHQVDIIEGLEVPDVPGAIARQLIFKFKPSQIKFINELFVENIKHFVLGVFKHMRQKIIDGFDEARTKAEARITGDDFKAFCKKHTIQKEHSLDSQARRSRRLSVVPFRSNEKRRSNKKRSSVAPESKEQRDIKHEFLRQKLVCEKTANALTTSLLNIDELEAIILPKATKMMAQILKHEPRPPQMHGIAIFYLKRLLVKNKIIPDPGKLLTGMMLGQFKSKLPIFVLTIVTQQNAALATAPGVGANDAVETAGDGAKARSLPHLLDIKRSPGAIGKESVDSQPNLQSKLLGAHVAAGATDEGGAPGWNKEKTDRESDKEEQKEEAEGEGEREQIRHAVAAVPPPTLREQHRKQVTFHRVWPVLREMKAKIEQRGGQSTLRNLWSSTRRRGKVQTAPLAETETTNMLASVLVD